MAEVSKQVLRDWLDRWCLAAEDTAYNNEQFVLSVMRADPAETYRARIIPQVLALEYLDSSGKPSQRSVRIHTLALSDKGIGLLQGYCYWRKAPRAFRMDRVISAIDEHGEIHAPPADFIREIFNAFAIEGEVPASPDRARKPRKPHVPIAATRFINAHAADFVLLKLMAGIDGAIDEMEKIAITDHVAKLWLQEDQPISSKAMTHVESWIDRLAPERRDYAAAVDAVMAKPPADIARLLRSMKIVLEADGRVDPREADLLDQVCIDIMA